MYSFDSRQTFRKSFYAIENTAELHYRLLNTLNLVVHNCYLYCFCSKYEGPREEFGSDQFCPLCRTPIFKKTLMNFWIKINSILVLWVIICFDWMSFWINVFLLTKNHGH